MYSFAVQSQQNFTYVHGSLVMASYDAML